jgi:hypothetical protein
MVLEYLLPAHLSTGSQWFEFVDYTSVAGPKVWQVQQVFDCIDFY